MNNKVYSSDITQAATIFQKMKRSASTYNKKLSLETGTGPGAQMKLAKKRSEVLLLSPDLKASVKAQKHQHNPFYIKD